MTELSEPRIATLLLFSGQAEEALVFYASIFEGSEIEHIERYVPGEQGVEGTVRRGSIRIAGQRLICVDSPVAQPFRFTPAMSVVVLCETEALVDKLFGLLSEGAVTLMPLDCYPFSGRFGWLTDRFGVSWQVVLNRV